MIYFLNLLNQLIVIILGVDMKVVIGITGASGIVYALRLVQTLRANDVSTIVISTEMGKELMEEEGIDAPIEEVEIDYLDDMFAPTASGSFKFDAMVVVPASMKTISSISNGYANNLVTRTADVTLKEGRDLIVVPRETPLNTIHLKNLYNLSKMGGKVLPASPGFYHNPKSVMDIVDHVVGKILDSLGIEHHLFKRWGENSVEKGLEVEFKVPVNIKEAKENIKSNGGRFIKKSRQIDTYFELDGNEILRVRESEGRSKLGFKRILKDDNSEFDEIEAGVVDAKKVISILNNLGYVEKHKVKKDRWYFGLDEVKLELNDIDKLGGYLDFEIISENESKAREKIFNVMNKLGYSKNDIESKLYFELLEEFEKS